MQIKRTPLVGTITPASGVPDFKNTGFSTITPLDSLDDIDTKKSSNYLDTQTIYQKETGKSSNPLLDKIVKDTTNPFPYSHMADDSNIITYKGVAFVGDSENNALCLGDMSQEDNVLSIPLSDGGVLKVNRNNFDDLSRAIGMFSPADVNRIMKAISTDAKARSKEAEIENMKLAPFMEN